MKKTLITAVAVLATLSMYGQGTVTFSNSGGLPVLNGVTGQNAAAGTTFRVGLYYGTSTTSDSAFTMIGASATIQPTAGFFSGSTRTVPAGMIDPGGVGQFQVRGWSAAYGTDYASVLANPAAVPNGLVGKTAIFAVDTGDPTTTPAGAPAGIATLMGQLTLTPVPEPSTIGLGLLGAISLLFLRRRK